MAIATEQTEKKDFGSPDETREFEKLRMSVVQLGGRAVSLGTYEPGWRWSEHIGKVIGGDACQVRHEAYVLKGRMHIALKDGSEMDIKAGEVGIVPPGHDAWVVGDEAVELLDFGGGMSEYARS